MAETRGYCDPAFSRVRDILQQRVAQGDELGASLCVNIDGKNVLDLWAGHADAAKTRPWSEDTLTVVWSCSKVVSALAAMILIDRGVLDADKPVSAYWPEFAANGKEGVTVGHVLSHASGLPAWEPPFSVQDLYDTKTATERLAQQKPWWTPGQHSGYHILNQGHLVGELVRRTTGKSLRQFIADEIATPLDADFRLGVEEENWPRTAEITSPPAIPLGDVDSESVMARAFVAPLIKAKHSMTPGFRAAEIGAANGFGNARALCRIGSVASLAGTVDGKRYLSPQTVDKMLQEQVRGQDLVIPGFMRFGLGVGLPVPQTVPWIPQGRVCFWGGWGGSIIVMDLDRRMTVGYAMNKMGAGTLGNANTEAYVKAIYAAVDGKGPSHL
ncbi:beta-lactamase [Aspergillus sp. HF37]|nr:beta-lactamase [Aspergillus sp. HF37]